ncbi:hypothetical protein ACFLRC_04400, partial [Candidatus Altiarchaeota archaeon]
KYQGRLTEMIDGKEERKEKLSDLQRKGLELLVKELKKGLSPEQLHKQIYELARSIELEPPQLFQAIYRVLIGRDKGPKAAMFLLSLDKDLVEKRFLGEN